MNSRALGMGLIFALMWSSAFTSARIIVQYAPPFSALSLRFFLSGSAAVILARILGQSWHLPRRTWIALCIYGVCQNAIYLGLNFFALQTVEASMAAIIASSMPLLVALSSWVWLNDKLPLLGVMGLFAGVMGVIVIMAARVTGGADITGIALCVAAVVSLTVATMTVRGLRSDGNALMVVGLQMLVGSAALLIPASLFDTFTVEWTTTLMIAFTYTTIVPGLLATLVWFRLVHQIGAVRASVFHFLTPFFGVAIAALTLGEPLQIIDFLGVAIITLGILAVQISKASR